jgi:hypothetical protein
MILHLDIGDECEFCGSTQEIGAWLMQFSYELTNLYNDAMDEEFEPG